MNTARANLPDLDDTIVALSSACGPAARAIVRLSGRRAVAIVAALGAEPNAGQLVIASLRLPSFHAPIRADVYFFNAPKSYTGQDVVEIHLVSCQPIVDVLIAQCLNAGARAAQAGEFTMRAFLAGKLDLTRAEAVRGVIEANDRKELTQALKQMAGGLESPLRKLRDDLLDLLADVEATLDFADEEILFVETDELLRRLGHALAHLILLKKQLHERAVHQRAFRVVLAGKTNAGKSSLFNALLGKDAALVSAEPATTRDYLEGAFTQDGVAVELIDTAGANSSVCSIDLAAQTLGNEQRALADLVLWCTAADEENDLNVPPNAIVVATKVDRAPAPSGSQPTSAKSGEGIENLRERLLERARQASRSGLASSLSRCAHHVEESVAHLQHAHALVIDDGMPELLALQIRLAIESLGALVGVVYTDDLLDRIFSRFCIGK